MEVSKMIRGVVIIVALVGSMCLIHAVRMQYLPARWGTWACCNCRYVTSILFEVLQDGLSSSLGLLNFSSRQHRGDTPD